MKKLYALLLLALAGTALQAQVTLTRADFPVIGDSAYYSLVDTTGWDPGARGSGVTWDFSGVTPLGSGHTVRYVDPANTPQSATFPDADIAMTSTNSGYIFYRIDADSVNLVGEKTITNQPVHYDSAASMILFPLNLNDSIFDFLTGVYPDGFFSNITRDSWIYTVMDGEGTLITPKGTYNNVARVHVFEYLKDSSWTGAADGEGYTEHYYWIESGTSTPIMVSSITAIQINMGAPQVVHEIMYADDFPIATEEALAGLQSVSLYPNPSEGTSTLELDALRENDVRITLTGVDGRELRTLYEGPVVRGNNRIAIDANGVAAGIYLVKITAEGHTAVRKLVLR